jgi:hypothetical protein
MVIQHAVWATNILLLLVVGKIIRMLLIGQKYMILNRINGMSLVNSIMDVIIILHALLIIIMSMFSAEFPRKIKNI